jgi:hypothetical protein
MAEKGFATAIVGKAKEEKREYLFRNNKMRGTSVTCFMGNAPKDGEWFKDTIDTVTMVDGQTVRLTESQAEHLRSRGVEKPVCVTDENGYMKPTGQTYPDERFQLNEVR